MINIFSQAFDASGEPEVGARLGKSIIQVMKNWKLTRPDPSTMDHWVLARYVLNSVRRFAEDNGDKLGPRKPVVAPTVHLNGTGKGMLMTGYSKARHGVMEAMEQIQQIEFNARDYYPQGDWAWDQACSEMKARLLSLQQVSDELLAIMEHIDKE